MFFNWILIILIIIMLVFNYWWLIFIFFIILIFISIKNDGTKLWITLLFVPAFLIHNSTIFSNDYINHHALIYKVKKNYLIVKEHYKKYKINYYNHYQYISGETIKYKGKYVLITNSKHKHSDSNFNAKTYFRSLNINYELTPQKITITKNSNNAFENKVKNIPSNLKVLKWFVESLILINNDTSSVLYSNALVGGYVNLLTVSGFHIAFLYFFINKVIRYLTFKKIKFKYISLISLTVIFMYVCYVRFPISATRASSFLIFNYINNYFLKKKFTNIDILSISGITFLFSNYYFVFSLSYILSFYCTLIVLFFNNYINKYFSKINLFNRGLILSTAINILIIPIIFYIDGYFNVCSVINNLIMDPIILIVYICQWIFIFIPNSNIFINEIDSIAVNVMDLLNNFNLIIELKNIHMSLNITFIITIILWFIIWIIEYLYVKKCYNY